MQRIDLPRIGTYAAWRAAARALAGADVPADTLLWVREGAEVTDLFATPAPLPTPDREITVPKAFVSLAKLAAHHSDPERFGLLYRLLTRLPSEPRLLTDRGDPLVDRLNRLAKEVGRDRHKMHAFVRFRDLGTDPDTPRRRFAAWFEPSHPILEIAAPFFAKRFGDMDWSIFTPDMTAHFHDRQLSFTDPAPRPDMPQDAAEDLWRTYFRSIFNPARLKVKAMQSEMPQKYWKNLPEAEIIPELIASAEARAVEMAAAAPTLAPARAAPVTARLAETQALAQGGEDQVRAALSACRRCTLWENATQPLPGVGPLDAPLMIVGEQPGDHEDLAGEPFVGPAGKLLTRAMKDAGIDRDRSYLTNAVKHFKFTPKARRRIHQTPSADEIQHCRWWLDLERERVQPRLILALGATAMTSLTGRSGDLMRRRSQIEETPDGTPVLITVHPAYLLRLPAPTRREAEEHLFAQDLRLAARLISL